MHNPVYIFRTKQIGKTIFMSQLFTILLIGWYGLLFASEPAIPTFTAFKAQFTPWQQQQTQLLWNEIKSKAASESLAAATKTTEAVSDNSLFRELTLENKEAFRSQLQYARQHYAEIAQSLAESQQKHAMWQQFSDALKDNPSMGSVYLKSLAVVHTSEKQMHEWENKLAEAEKEITTIRVNASLSQVSLNFTFKDWIVIIVYLIFTTILGALLAGKQASMKDFFLGGRKLAWPAVCGSIIATELSAATFLIAPAIVFSKGGDMTYIQLAIGTIVARFIIGYFFIPVYYEKEIYSPYDYMGNQLGPRVKNITSVLFMIGGILAQGARVYIAAKALQVVTGANITTSIMIIGAVSIAWTIMGGITTVIWTDAIQFVLFSLGAVAALAYVHTAVDGGLMTVISEGIQAGKFNMLNLNFNTKEAFTLWCGLFATGFLTLGSHGTDQLMAQRMFTCKSQTDARKAIVWSSASQLLTITLLLVGASIFVYYKYIPLNAPEQVIVNNDSMKIFAIYIVDVMPPMLSGLLMAALFATAISTLDSILAALSQTTISILYKPYIKPQGSDKHYVRASRVLVFIWGILLTGFAIYCDVIAQRFADLIQFALAMAAYTYGALLGTFLLAFLPTKRDDLGLMWGVPLSMLIVFAFNWHQPAAQWIVLIACLVLIIQAFRHFQSEPQKVAYIGIAAGIVLIVSMAITGTTAAGAPVHISLAWPWHYPIGAIMTFGIGYLVGNRRS
ncbi:sodium/solute symporter [candidate division KSB1 bacterium]|nr:sodium/solute symporter [candidate division KSB1 bacterium]